MFLKWKEPFPKSHMCTFTALVFHHTAVFLLLTHSCGGQSQMVGPTGPVLAMLGEDTVLPCHLEPATDVTAMTLEWARSDLKPRFVHLWRDGVEILVNQHPSYAGRTSLSSGSLKQGDISLKLLNVKLSDEGEYRCHIPEVAMSTVQLAVGAVSFSIVVKVEVDKTTSRVVLQCESAGWYPEPEVSWLDGEGNLLSADPTETIRGCDGLFTVCSKVTVEKGNNNKFLCRVQQETINQTRSTEIQIPEEVFMDSTCSTARILIVMVSSLGFMLSSAFLFALWKLGQRKLKNKMEPESETEGTEENDQLVEGSLESKNLAEKKAKLDEKLKDINEVKEVVLHVLEILNDRNIELENFLYEQQTQFETMEKEYVKNETKLKKLGDKYKWDLGDKKSQLLEQKLELESKRKEDQKCIESNKNRLQKTKAKITSMTGMKERLENQMKQIKAELEETDRQRGGDAQGSV